MLDGFDPLDFFTTQMLTVWNAYDLDRGDGDIAQTIAVDLVRQQFLQQAGEALLMVGGQMLKIANEAAFAVSVATMVYGSFDDAGLQIACDF